MLQWVAFLNRNLSVVSSIPIKGSRSFYEQDTLTSLLVLVGFRKGFARDFTIELQ